MELQLYTGAGILVLILVWSLIELLIREFTDYRRKVKTNRQRTRRRATAKFGRKQRAIRQEQGRK